MILYKELREGISENMTCEMRLSEEELTVMFSKQKDGKSKHSEVGSEGAVNGRDVVREAVWVRPFQAPKG